MAAKKGKNPININGVSSNNNNNNKKEIEEVESPSNSQGSSTHLPLSPLFLPQEVKQEEIRPMDCGIAPPEVDQKPHIVPDGFQDFTAEEILKYQRYEADYARHLRAKYFSNKDFYGADLFDLTVAIGDETIKAGRCSPTRSYVNPARTSKNTVSVMVSVPETPSAAEAPPNVSNGHMNPQKSSLQ